MEIVGPWRFTYQTLMAAGVGLLRECSGSGTVGTRGYSQLAVTDVGRDQLTALEIGDIIRIEESTTRHQTITLTLAPEVNGLNITIYGTADRAGQFEIPATNADVTVTVIPQGIDQGARDDAATAQSEIDAHEVSTHNTDATARAAAGNGASERRRGKPRTGKPRGYATRRRRYACCCPPRAIGYCNGGWHSDIHNATSGGGNRFLHCLRCGNLPRRVSF